MKTIFGTDGIRARVGENLLTEDNLIAFGSSFAAWAQDRFNKKKPNILIIHDTRASHSWIISTLLSGLLKYPLKVYNGGVLPTPGALALMQSKEKNYTIDCSLIISASHNPHYDNGIKILTRFGKMSPEDEILLSQLFYEHHKNPQKINNFFGQSIQLNTIEQLYRSFLTAHFTPQFLKNYTIVLDCAHGATYKTAPNIFRELGANVIVINNQPTGYNINKNCGALHPESLQKAVIKHNACAGFAFDGDGDRVTAVTKNGVVKDGDDILSLLMHHTAYSKMNYLVGTTMTNLGLEHYLNQRNKLLLRTHVGDKYVQAQMKEKNILLGGEQSGHIIMNDILETGDGILAALRLMESLITTQNFTMESFIKYPQILLSLPVKEKFDLNQIPFNHIINKHKKLLPHGRIIVRYSGTEPVLRIMTEDLCHSNAFECAQSLQKELAQTFDQAPIQGFSHEKNKQSTHKNT